MAGVVVRLRPFVAQLWAALHETHEEQLKIVRGESRARPRPKDGVFVRRVDHALLLLKAFFDGELGPLRRKYTLSERNAKPRFYLRGDASTSGMGDILLDAVGHPVEYWADDIRREDLERFGAKEGDSAFMGEFELLRILVSLHVWGPKLRGMSGAFVVQADSQAALGAALKLASPRPLMNAIAAEISLVLERFEIEKLTGDHYRGSINVDADALSRLREGAEIPSSLLNTPRVGVPPRSDNFYKAWPPSWKSRPN